MTSYSANPHRAKKTFNDSCTKIRRLTRRCWSHVRYDLYCVDQLELKRKNVQFLCWSFGSFSCYFLIILYLFAHLVFYLFVDMFLCVCFLVIDVSDGWVFLKCVFDDLCTVQLFGHFVCCSAVVVYKLFRVFSSQNQLIAQTDKQETFPQSIRRFSSAVVYVKDTNILIR